MSEKIIFNMNAKGHTLLGCTKGTYSFRKGSNLSKMLEILGKKEHEVEVLLGARAGRWYNDGYELLIFDVLSIDNPNE